MASDQGKRCLATTLAGSLGELIRRVVKQALHGGNGVLGGSDVPERVVLQRYPDSGAEHPIGLCDDAGWVGPDQPCAAGADRFPPFGRCPQYQYRYPKPGASSWMPPESVSTSAARRSARIRSG